MNEAKQQLDAGNLSGAVEAALANVKSKPTDIQARIFLFELSCFTGDWERAERQLAVIADQDPNATISMFIYRQNIAAERARAKFFSDGLQPGILAPPPPYVEDLIHANNRIREGNIGEARELFDKIEEERPAFKALVNGSEVSDFRDYNDPTMCILEVFFKEQYVWLPFEHIQKIEFFQPKSLRDLFWVQAQIELVEGTNGEMFVPSLYTGSWKSGNDQVRLGRMTDWQDLGSDTYSGEGSKLFWMDGQEKSLLELRSLEFIHEDAEEEKI